jgi:multidrug/hemolysin transport system ATP-binding protein
MDNIIEVKDLHKSYGEIKAVRGTSFSVERGSFFAFLGPNGAGKSTTIDILCTILKADSGEVNIDGHILGKEDSKIRQKIGVVFQHSVLDVRLTVKENLENRASMYGLKRSEIKARMKEVSDMLDLEVLLKRQYGKLSGGQKRRCDIARALMSTPTILFLDEPTTGLDPQSRKNIQDKIQMLKNEFGVTIFLTTHYMEEAAEADRICIIDEGKIVANGTPAELKDNYSSDKLILYSKDTEKIKDILGEGVKYTENIDTISVNIEDAFDSLALIEKVKPYIFSFEVVQGTLDDVFINITGKQLRDDVAIEQEINNKKKFDLEKIKKIFKKREKK